MDHNFKVVFVFWDNYLQSVIAYLILEPLLNYNELEIHPNYLLEWDEICIVTEPEIIVRRSSVIGEANFMPKTGVALNNARVNVRIDYLALKQRTINKYTALIKYKSSFKQRAMHTTSIGISSTNPKRSSTYQPYLLPSHKQQSSATNINSSTSQLPYKSSAGGGYGSYVSSAGGCGSGGVAGGCGSGSVPGGCDNGVYSSVPRMLLSQNAQNYQDSITHDEDSDDKGKLYSYSDSDDNISDDNISDDNISDDNISDGNNDDQNDDIDTNMGDINIDEASNNDDQNNNFNDAGNEFGYDSDSDGQISHDFDFEEDRFIGDDQHGYNNGDYEDDQQGYNNGDDQYVYDNGEYEEDGGYDDSVYDPG